MAYTERYIQQCEEHGLDPQTGTKFTLDQLEAAFKAAVVGSAETYEEAGGIYAQVALEAVEVTVAAITYFMATVPKVVKLADKKLSGYRMLIAYGYWMGPVGDRQRF